MDYILSDTVRELLNDLNTAIKAVMVQRAPSLKGSDLVDSTETKVVAQESTNKKQSATLSVFMNYYAEYVDRGRPAGIKKVPIMPLLNWIKKKRIKGRNKITGRFITDNQLAFAIQNGIFKNGIQGKNFLSAVEITANEVSERIIDQIEIDKIVADVDKQFK